VKGSVWIVAIATFVAAILTFSRGYGEVLRYFDRPTPQGLVTIILLLALLVFLIGVMGFIMYAVDRRVGNVKNKVHLFERLLGHNKDAVLPDSEQGSQEQRPQEAKK
jgi:preprotein translocase subunit Sss1